MRNRIPRLLALVAMLALAQTLRATEPPRVMLTLKDLDCPSCAKKLAAKLVQVPGVAEVKTDLDTRAAAIRPQPNRQVSPRALWDMAEKAGFEPVKLEAPDGTFTEKPKN